MGMNIQEAMASPLVWHPQTAAEAWQLKQTYGTEGIYTSGGTLLRTQWESGISAIPRHLIDLSTIRGLNDLRIGEAGLVVGGQTSLQSCRSNTLLSRHFPMVSEAIRTIAAPSVRHLATIGGNVASSIGDSIAALLGYDAEVIWFDGTTENRTLLSEWLPEASAAKRGNERLLLSMLLPFEISLEETSVKHDDKDLTMQMKRFGAYHKIGRREAFTPSVVTACMNGVLTHNSVIKQIRIALGGGQTVPVRLEKLEKEINGAAVDGHLLRHVYERIIELFEPREDLFASAAYRKSTAANLIVAELWKAAKGETKPL
ncbi:FAD binding domain-containing protein [Paenibacillus paridis]|uniref:FAD binding domain-containing protein n=1 Tax=Paenibacillus paridis TaxID=2583376 RepID=UPI00111FF5F4|nr:FAD binding domain-containing protein [Paenibacillus paridis]